MKTDRLISIIMVLLEREKVSATKLAEMFEVTTRTIYRDIDAIELAGIPIVTYSGVNGGISIMEQYKVNKNLFTTKDIGSLVAGLSSIPNTLSDKSIRTTLAKIKSMVPESQLKAIELRSNQISIDLNAWMGNRNLEPFLTTIKYALDTSTQLKFQYRDRNQTHSNRTVEPYRMVLKNGSWYLQCYCLEREAYRSFKLSRVSKLINTDIIFEPRDFQPLAMDGSGITKDRLIFIKLSLDISLRERIVDRCGEESILLEKDNTLLVNFPFIQDETGYEILFSFADKCEILEPAFIREEMKRRVESLFQRYQDTKENSVSN